MARTVQVPDLEPSAPRLTWEMGAFGQSDTSTSKSGMRPARPFPGSGAKVLARAGLSGFRRPALELSS